METNEKTVYWVCTETLTMKGGDVAFKKGEKYPQVKPIKDDVLVLRNEQGGDHTISPEKRGEHFEIES